MDELTAAGNYSSQEADMHLNSLEMKAVLLGLPGQNRGSFTPVDD